jgi:endonuclease YncB( thermonuclease family)
VYRIARVADGDTLTLANGQRVRLVQIDTPEVYFGAECYGRAASNETKRLLPIGTRVRLMVEPATDRLDQYGRLLRYVIRVRDGLDVNVRLVAVGAAAPYFYGGRRGMYANRLELLARRAKAKRLGLWGACPHTRYDPYKRSRDRPLRSTPGGRGARREHVPDGHLVAQRTMLYGRGRPGRVSARAFGSPPGPVRGGRVPAGRPCSSRHRRRPVVEADVAQKGGAERMVETAVRELGRLDVVVNAAIEQAVAAEACSFSRDLHGTGSAHRVARCLVACVVSVVSRSPWVRRNSRSSRRPPVRNRRRPELVAVDDVQALSGSNDGGGVLGAAGGTIPRSSATVPDVELDYLHD